MGAFAFTIATSKIAKADVDLDTADIRIKLVCSNTTAGTDRDATNIAGISVLDEYDGSGYTALDLAGITVTRVDASDHTRVTATSGNFGATVGAATRSVKALLYYVRVDGTTTNDWPLMYDDTPPQFASGTFNGDGGPLNVTLPAAGFLQIQA